MSLVTKINWVRQLIEVVLIFTFGGCLEVFVFCPGCAENFSDYFLSFIYTGIFWVFLWKGSEFGVLFLDSRLPWVKFPVWRTIASLIWVIGLTFFVTKFLDIVLDMLFLGMSFEKAVKNENASFLQVLLFNSVMNLIMHGRGFLMSWRQASIDLEKLKTEQVFTQFQSLKNQVNPHFLFNSLNALTSLVYEDQDKAVKFIRKLSQVYRYVLENKDEEIVPLEEELDFLESFVFLQKIRFGDNLKFELEGKRDGFIPPLALQLLVENAIKHNVISDDHHLNVKVLIEEDYCEISNNIKEKLSKDSTGIGLSNLKARYEYLTDKKVIMENDGQHFVIKIPILKFKNEVHNH